MNMGCKWWVLGVMACVVAGAEVPDKRAAQETAAMAATVRAEWPNGIITTLKSPGAWTYEEGVVLDGMAAEWRQSKDAKDFAYIKAAVDKYVSADGVIHVNPSGAVFETGGHTLDNIEMGRAVLMVYRTTHELRYQRAAEFLHEQLAVQPRTASGGYWHKQIYPNQMWLDGAYMAEPFRAEYAATFGIEHEFGDIAKQFLLMDEHMRDPKTGLPRHGWDESKKMPWADPQTGLSPEVWARALGWYAMALVDTLEWFPEDHPKRAALVADLNRTMAAVVKYQDESGTWWQVMDKGGAKGNFAEASASCMFVYALERGVRKGYLPAKPYEAAALKGWQGIQKAFVRPEADGHVVLTTTVKAAGLGGKPYRSGTYEYYVGEAVGDNDAKGVGAYLLAGSEMRHARAEMGR
ncbi:glycoside hydrolase family 88/105 protein [Granulicella tundricola]|nr:glycoside hydrolase family 88 protein [Granulicella tundricola]